MSRSSRQSVVKASSRAVKDSSKPDGGDCTAAASDEGAPSVFVVHRNSLHGESLRFAIRGSPRLRCVGWATELASCAAKAAEQGADLLLIEAGSRVPDVSRQLRRARSRETVRWLVPFEVESEDDALRLIEAGAHGWIAAGASLSQLIAGVRSIAEGRPPCTPAFAYRVRGRIAALSTNAPPMSHMRLTRAERRVLGLLERELSNKEIALELDVTVSTVKSHVHSILQKLRVDSRRRIALRVGPTRARIDSLSRRASRARKLAGRD